MREDNWYLKFVRSFLPSPFTIAVLLTAVTFGLAWLLTEPQQEGNFHGTEILGYWQQGFWELLAFTMQMVLILILGHTLALSGFFSKVIDRLSIYCNNTANAAFIISFVSIGVSFINWGLCLIVGAVFARKVAERAKSNDISINYPILAAAGYCGLMTWHGGFSGSAPLKVAEANHFLADSIGQIAIVDTILSSMNITASLLVIMVIPTLLYFIGRNSQPTAINLSLKKETVETDSIEGAEKLDHSKLLARGLGIIMVGFALFSTINSSNGSPLSFINLNYINFLLFGLGILFHGTFSNFLSAITEAIKGATGIIIQFPLYAGIMGIMKYSGLVVIFSNFFIDISNEVTFPIFTFISAGIVNTFVPSGGGQWAVQGPIICEAASVLNVPISKAIMALAYGDQLTNMLQPFWALPLLGITQLKAKDILPYSFIVMLVGAVLYAGVLLYF